MTQEMVSKSRFVRVQSFGDSLSVSIPKPFAKELGIEKHATVRTWMSENTFHVEKAKE